MRLSHLLAGTAFALTALAGTAAHAENWADSGFDGLSIGKFGGYVDPCGCYELGINFGGGAGFAPDVFGAGTNAFVGGDLRLSYIPDFSSFDVSVNGRVGVEWDKTVLAYGTAGIGQFDGSSYFSAGGGLELKVHDNVSVGAEAVGINFGSGFSEVRIGGFIKYHFDFDSGYDDLPRGGYGVSY